MGSIPSARDRLLAEILGLPVEERLDIVEQIWASLPPGAYEPELTEEMKAELDRRLADLEENPEEGYTWEEVKARLHKSR
jgi:putative addiction module component (TIGR02574 family)